MEQNNNENLDQALDDLQQSKALNSQQAQQISDLINRYSALEKMHNETLKILDQLSNGGPHPKAVKITAEETASISKITKQNVTDFVNRLIKTSKLKSQTALRISMKTMRVDSLLSSLSSGLKGFAEKLGQLEQKIQGLGIEQQPPKLKVESKIEDKPETAKRPQVRMGERSSNFNPIIEKKTNTEPTLEPETASRPRVRVGENIPVNETSQENITKNVSKIEPSKQEEIAKELKTSTSKVETINENQRTSVAGLPEDFRPILEEMFIPIDAAHEKQDKQGNPTYGYRANYKVDVPGIPLELINGLDSQSITNLLKADLIDRIMDKRLSVDEVFNEQQKSQMVSAYSKSTSNAFEKRVAKAEVNKKEQKAAMSQSQEVTQEKHRSR